jgi:hypothetical protein
MCTPPVLIASPQAFESLLRNGVLTYVSKAPIARLRAVQFVVDARKLDVRVCWTSNRAYVICLHVQHYFTAATDG